MIIIIYETEFSSTTKIKNKSRIQQDISPTMAISYIEFVNPRIAKET